MGRIASDRGSYAGQETPHTVKGQRGIPVCDNVAIAVSVATSFDDRGSYGNHTDGNSHAATLVEQQQDGLLVLGPMASLSGLPPSNHSHDGQGKLANDGDQLYVIEKA